MTLGLRTQRLLLAAACGLFLLQSLPLFTTRWVIDESWYAVSAYSLLTEGKIRNPTFSVEDNEYRIDARPPGFAIVVQPIFRFFGVGVIQARVLPLVAGLGVVVAAFLLGKRFGGTLGGAAAAFFAAGDNTLWLTARTARPEIFVALFGEIGLLLYVKSKDTGCRWASFLSGVSVGAALDFHHLGLASAAAIAVLFVVEFRLRVFTQLRFWLYALGAAALVLPFLVWTHSSPIYSEAFNTMYGRGSTQSIWAKISEEVAWRYADFAGVNVSVLGFPPWIPWRLPILAVIGVSFVALWRTNRSSTLLALVFLAASLLWFLYTVNKSIRYFVILAPVFAAVVGGGTIKLLRHRSLSRLAAALFCGVLLYEIAGNAAILYQYRDSDYRQVTAELNRIIRPSTSVYGTLTLWMALHDRAYGSYERLPLSEAVNERATDYLIANDRVMSHGTRRTPPPEALRAEVYDYARRHGRLVGTIPSAFYGDLEVYELRGAP
jgi:4-amino-4-deoxy-L-arabinose transferase-like glycosyltransferase